MEAAFSLDTLDYEFRDPPEKREPISARIPAPLKRHLLSVVKLWKAIAVARGHDEADVDISYVVESMLKVGVDSVWERMAKQAGLKGPPETDEDWDAIQRAVEANNAPSAAKTTPKKK